LLTINTEIDDELIQTFKLSNLIRSPSVLLSDVTEFMTLRKGDVLLLGVQYQAPQAKIGSEVRISCAGFEDLKFSLAALGDAS
jgi:5-oxopent-3-ene-1,2,5-tricarboxylate decarboxylase/2-hydroxyhepta-2,4-diene-1,7-dioate isomerase